MLCSPYLYVRKWLRKEIKKHLPSFCLFYKMSFVQSLKGTPTLRCRDCFLPCEIDYRNKSSGPFSGWRDLKEISLGKDWENVLLYQERSADEMVFFFLWSLSHPDMTPSNPPSRLTKLINRLTSKYHKWEMDYLDQPTLNGPDLWID